MYNYIEDISADRVVLSCNKLLKKACVYPAVFPFRIFHPSAYLNPDMYVLMSSVAFGANDCGYQTNLC